MNSVLSYTTRNDESGIFIPQSVRAMLTPLESGKALITTALFSGSGPVVLKRNSSTKDLASTVIFFVFCGTDIMAFPIPSLFVSNVPTTTESASILPKTLTPSPS